MSEIELIRKNLYQCAEFLPWNIDDTAQYDAYKHFTKAFIKYLELFPSMTRNDRFGHRVILFRAKLFLAFVCCLFGCVWADWSLVMP